MADQRKPRELETRDNTMPRAEFVPPSVLPEPLPQDGWAFRWIALSVLGQANPTNVSSRMREGWEPVKAVDHPELMLPANKHGNVEVGGLMLCKAPAEMAEARTAYYRKQAKQQLESVNAQLMSNNNPRMPLFNEQDSQEVRGRGQFGSGTK